MQHKLFVSLLLVHLFFDESVTSARLSSPSASFTSTPPAGQRQGEAVLRNLGITPGFLKPETSNVDFTSQFVFYVEVSSATHTLTVSASPVGNQAVLRINDSPTQPSTPVHIDVPYGSSDIRIDVIEGDEQNTYHVVALRQPPLLEDLQVSSGSFIPEFHPSHTDYLLVVPYERDPITDEVTPKTISLRPFTSNSDVNIYVNGVEISENNSEKLPDPNTLLMWEVSVEVQQQHRKQSEPKVYRIMVVQQEQSLYDLDTPPPRGFPSDSPSHTSAYSSCGSFGNVEQFEEVTVLDANRLVGSPNIHLGSPATLTSMGVFIPEALVGRQIKLALFSNDDQYMSIGSPVAWTVAQNTQPGRLDLNLESHSHVNINLEAGTYWLLAVISESKDITSHNRNGGIVEMYSSNTDRAIPFVKIDHPFSTSFEEINFEKGLTREVGIQLNMYINTKCEGNGFGQVNPYSVQQIGSCCPCDAIENELPQVAETTSIETPTAKVYQWSPGEYIFTVIGMGSIFLIGCMLISSVCKISTPTRDRFARFFGRLKQIPKKVKSFTQENLPTLPLHLRQHPPYPAIAYETIARQDRYFDDRTFNSTSNQVIQDVPYESGGYRRPIVVLGAGQAGMTEEEEEEMEVEGQMVLAEYKELPQAERLEFLRGASAASATADREVNQNNKKNSIVNGWASTPATYRSISENLGLKPFRCPWCKLAFSQKGNWTVHKRLHTGDKRFKCHICFKTFARKQTLISHVRIHSNEKPHKCDSCDRTFTQKSQLVRHRRTHTGSKPFPCKLCTKKFSDKRNLISHLKKKHPSAAPKLLKVLQRTRRGGVCRQFIKIEEPEEDLIVMKQETKELKELKEVDSHETAKGKGKGKVKLEKKNEKKVRREKKKGGKKPKRSSKRSSSSPSDDDSSSSVTNSVITRRIQRTAHRAPIPKLQKIQIKIEKMSDGNDDEEMKEMDNIVGQPMLTPPVAIPFHVDVEVSTLPPLPSPSNTSPLSSIENLPLVGYEDRVFPFMNDQNGDEDMQFDDRDMKIDNHMDYFSSPVKLEEFLPTETETEQTEAEEEEPATEVDPHSSGRSRVGSCLPAPIKMESVDSVSLVMCPSPTTGNGDDDDVGGVDQLATGCFGYFEQQQQQSVVKIDEDFDEMAHFSMGFDFTEETAFDFAGRHHQDVEFDFFADFSGESPIEPMMFDDQTPMSFDQSASNDGIDVEMDQGGDRGDRGDRGSDGWQAENSDKSGFSFLDNVLNNSPRTFEYQSSAFSLSLTRNVSSSEMV